MQVQVVGSVIGWDVGSVIGWDVGSVIGWDVGSVIGWDVGSVIGRVAGLGCRLSYRLGCRFSYRLGCRLSYRLGCRFSYRLGYTSLICTPPHRFFPRLIQSKLHWVSYGSVIGSGIGRVVGDAKVPVGFCKILANSHALNVVLFLF